MASILRRKAGFCLAACIVVSLGCPHSHQHDHDGGTVKHTLFVGHDGVLVAWSIETGEELPGTVSNVPSPSDMQVLEDGTVMANLTASNEVLAVNGATMIERARIASSGIGGVRPVHSYLSPERNGRRYWLALNDGVAGDAGTNGARFIDARPGADGFLAPAGDVRTGVGHHKAAFSSTKERVVISNISDCNNVLSVYDYSDPANIRTLKEISARELGWDGSSRPRTCDTTFQNGVPPAPHGCATSKLSGKAYCHLTGSGEVVAIAIDADPPTFSKIATGGSGAGYTYASKDGRYVYTVNEVPREGAGGTTCQIGQLVTIDAQSDAVVHKLPLLYRGPGCTQAVNGTDEETAEPGHILISKDGKTMFVGLAGGFGVATARVRYELVVDLSNPAQPVQKASIPVGASTGHHGDTLSGDGRYVFVANNVDNTVTQIDVASLSVARTITVKSTPRVVATFGTEEGPSKQTGPIE